MPVVELYQQNSDYHPSYQKQETSPLGVLVVCADFASESKKFLVTFPCSTL